MPYLVLEDARGGVDRRRPIYAAPPGTLWSCINAHISKGGDVDIRKHFADIGSFSENTYGLVAAQQTLYTFGSDPPSAVSLPGSVQYQQLQHPGGIPMVGFVDADLFDGKIYVLARFADGMVLHFYDGALVTAWSDGIVRADMSGLGGIATMLAALIDADANYIATAAGAVVTVTAATAGVPFTVATSALNGGIVDDQTLTNANVTPNTAAVAAAAASFAFSVAGGAAAGTITSVRIGGVEAVSGGPVTWATSNTAFAAALAANIAAFAGTSGYTATSVGQQVTVTATATGVAANDLSVEVTTTGTARAGSQSSAGTSTIGVMSGGVAAVAAVAQVNTLTVGGTFDPGDGFGVQLTSGTTNLIASYFGNYANPFGVAACVKTHKRKVYVGAGAILYFSRVNDATAWNSDEDPGAGFLNASTHCGGSESVLSLETYQGRLSVASKEAFQLWTMQNDDDQNALDQVLENCGTRSARALVEFGGNDVFYLGDTGIRSLKARDASNNAFVSDVGVAIDAVVSEWLRQVQDSDVVNAVGMVEPEDGRFWLAVGTRVFVYSFFPTVKISGWSWYELSFTPTDFAKTGKQAWARGDDNHLYLYGGFSAIDYGNPGDFTPEIQHPFVTSQKPGDFKNFTGMDIAATGTWNCDWLVDPNNLDVKVNLGENEGVTFPDANWAGVGHFTHIAPKLVGDSGSYACVSKLALYYAPADRKGP